MRKIDTQGQITTSASNLSYSTGVAVAPNGTLYICDNSRVLKVGSDGEIAIVAGSYQSGYSGDGGPAIRAELSNPFSLAFDHNGNLFVADSSNFRIRRIDTNGMISTFVGTGQFGTPVAGAAIASPLLYGPVLSVDPTGSLYIFESGYLLKVDTNGVLSPLSTNGGSFFVAAPGPLNKAQLTPGQLAFDNSGNLYLTDYYAHCLFRSSPAGIIQAVAGYSPGFGIGDNGPGLSAGLSGPQGLGLMLDGSLLIADQYNDRIRRLSASGLITTSAGSGVTGYTSPGAASSASLPNPQDVISDAAGNIYISDGPIFRVDLAGFLSTFKQQGGVGLAFDPQGNLLVAYNGTSTIQKISPDGTSTTTLAGNGQQGFSGDGGPGLAAQLNQPQGLAVDFKGDVFIGDTGNNRIRKVTPDGIISTIAGGGANEIDGVAATQSAVFAGYPFAMTCDRIGNLYFTDGNRVRKIDTNGIITTVAGAGAPGFAGDGGPSTAALLNNPSGVVVDNNGNVYISDRFNNRIRKILATPPALSVSTSQITVSAPSRSAAIQTNVTVNSDVQGLGYTINFSTQSGGDWLGFSQLQGQAPGVLTIIADPNALQPGTYQGTVALNNPYTSPQTLSIDVTLQVGAAQPAKLALGSQSLSFAFTGTNNQYSNQLAVLNQGGGSLAFTGSASTATGGSWLQVSPQTGNASPSTPGNLTVTATRGNLAPGTYIGAITVASAATGQQIAIPVTLAVSNAPQQIVLSQTGMTFVAVAQGGATLPQNFGILNIGSGSMNWTATASTLSGSGWLSVSPTTGTVNRPFLDVSFVDVMVNAKLLTPGTYYGNIQVTAPGASNSPQTVVVVLNVLSTGSNPGPQLRPSGLIFTGAAGASNPGSQSVMVANVTGSPTTYGSSVTYVSVDASGSIKYLPANATVAPDSPVQVVVQPDFSTLGTGVRRAALTLAFDDSSIRTVSILTVVAPAGTASVANAKAGRDASACVATKLVPVFEQLGLGSTIPTGFPAEVTAKVVDDCGQFLTSGSVVASFSNGDPPLSLINLQNGEWSTNWQPGNISASGVTVTLTAQSPGLLAGTVQQTIALQGGQTTAPLLSGMPLSAVTQTPGPLAPGEVVMFKGSSLADAQASSTTSPLPQQLAGASVLINGQSTSLLYADNGQLVGVVPIGLPENSSLQIFPLRDSVYGIPSSVIVAATQPAVFVKGGGGTGQAAAYKGGLLADASNPVQPGDTVIIYCAGLGSVDGQGLAKNLVSVSIGRQSAQVIYAGIAVPGSYPAEGPPSILGVSTGLGGLYQVTITVPSGVAGGPALVMVSSAGQTSQAGVALIVGTPGPPAISSVNTAYGSADIAQNDFIEIHGTNLAAEIAGPAALIAQLGGVSVTVNGKPALLYYVSPGQINALTPLDATTGPVSVVVTTNGTQSASYTANLHTVTPAFLRFDAGGHITATHADGTLLGPPSLGSGFTPAKPEDTIVTYAVGFGQPLKPLVSGSATQSSPLPSLPVCQISGTPATVTFAGLNGFAGLYQLNLVVPASTANGDNPVSCIYGGQSTPGGTLLNVEQ